MLRQLGAIAGLGGGPGGGGGLGGSGGGGLGGSGKGGLGLGGGGLGGSGGGGLGLGGGEDGMSQIVRPYWSLPDHPGRQVHTLAACASLRAAAAAGTGEAFT